ncbi:MULTISPECIES: DUF58 domain-containing protein [Methylobacterium]|uniref:DUF58 domain-containing protein n=2 Tax=Pseudomonadota TaxID=1224 RepID=A0ABQ4STV1_9HYPH|nr:MULTISPECIES: DUF58 domain-containing protein [Methylobacterium]PIU06218.1 MAG: DUF58 domain-containing protein [Methylobacterium sp. CG09_land_8_20_14_0_10_71_15]PIU14509.1 MAG: DUF58 domain-containing protein [Methylobacterium sp. CG08_land_8_20_14_0_20_71_15]GBU19328.1 hypothetical protein AwMethylo_35430 [Methylobacterium sp.]GJE05199.1 hypothetical protein AOPFMNJM_0496 [Methylobacterium jeotgali]
MTASAAPSPADAYDAPGVRLSGEALMGLRHLARRGVSPATRTLAGLPGGIVTRRRGRGSEPDDVRLWSEGDDVRHIDRNATARTGQLHVRTHHDERDRAVVLVADFRPSMLFGTRRALRSVAAAEALVLLGWRIVGDGGRVGLVVASGGEPTVLRPAGGERAMTALTGALSAAHAAALASEGTEDPPLAPLLGVAHGLMPSGGHLVLASALDAPGEAFDAQLTLVAERLSVRLILVSDRFERARPPGFYPFALPDGRRGAAEGLRNSGREEADARLATYAGRGIEGLRLDVEAGPEAYAPLMERLDAVL